MENNQYRQRLTELGWWGIFFVVFMPIFSVFFYKLHLGYSLDVVHFLAQDMAHVAGTAQLFSRVFAGMALGFLLFPACGIVMIFLGREFYKVEELPDPAA